MASISPVPFKIPISDENGNLTQAWSKWFSDLFNRIGGLSAPTNSVIQTTLTSHTTSINSNTASIAILQADVDGLKQGTVL